MHSVLSKRERLSEEHMETAINAVGANCPLSPDEIMEWTQKLGLSGDANEHRLRTLITFRYRQAVGHISVEAASHQGRVRDYIDRRVYLEDAPEKITLPSHFERVDQWLPEIADRLAAIRSELLALPGDIQAAIHIQLEGYEVTTELMGVLVTVLNDLGKSWYRPRPGQPSRIGESEAVDLLAQAIEDFTGEILPSPRSFKRLDEYALLRLLIQKLFPEVKAAGINTMLRHFYDRRRKQASTIPVAGRKKQA